MPDVRTATPDAIAHAAALLQAGHLVAFPTETVYGLGANALNADAVERIFKAKGRPASNPIIVHVDRPEAVDAIAIVDDVSRRLMAALWPGPLTLVLTKLNVVPNIVTAGGPTVAVRMPRHNIALALISAAGVPLAAPSANRSESLSPTTAEHVADGLGDAIELILDGGPCEVGIESTVVDASTDPVRILRPGMVTAAMISAAIGVGVQTYRNPLPVGRPAAAPGQLPRHYAPATPLLIVKDAVERALASPGSAVLTYRGETGTGENSVVLPGDPAGYAAGLYAALHKLDRVNADVILVEQVPSSDDWRAIRDRLNRASRQPGDNLNQP